MFWLLIPLFLFLQLLNVLADRKSYAGSLERLLSYAGSLERLLYLHLALSYRSNLCDFLKNYFKWEEYKNLDVSSEK